MMSRLPAGSVAGAGDPAFARHDEIAGKKPGLLARPGFEAKLFVRIGIA